MFVNRHCAYTNNDISSNGKKFSKRYNFDCIKNYYWGWDFWLNHDIKPSKIEFKYKAGGGFGADGFVSMFHKKKDYIPWTGGFLAFQDSLQGLHQDMV